MIYENLFYVRQKQDTTGRNDNFGLSCWINSISNMSSPSIFHTTYPTLGWSLEPIPGILGHKAGDTMDVVPTHRRAQSYTHTHNLEIQISLQRMYLDWRRKPEYQKETPEVRGEPANSTHTGWRLESSPQPWRCMESMLTIKPLCPLHGFSKYQNSAVMC